jgi:hypothetical protein
VGEQDAQIGLVGVGVAIAMEVACVVKAERGWMQSRPPAWRPYEPFA